MKFSIFFSSLLLTFSVHADVGFKKGNDLTAVVAKGELHVRCQGRTTPNYAHAFCRRDLLISGEYDYFQGPTSIKADKVTLTARHVDGSKRSKTVNYNATNRQSTKQVNLWIHTLLQKPLLDGGENKISYQMTLKGSTTARGEFTAVVHDGGMKFCRRTGNYWSGNDQDCRNPNILCDQYFRENDYCL